MCVYFVLLFSFFFFILLSCFLIISSLFFFVFLQILLSIPPACLPPHITPSICLSVHLSIRHSCVCVCVTHSPPPSSPQGGEGVGRRSVRIEFAGCPLQSPQTGGGSPAHQELAATAAHPLQVGPEPHSRSPQDPQLCQSAEGRCVLDCECFCLLGLCTPLSPSHLVTVLCSLHITAP